MYTTPTRRTSSLKSGPAGSAVIDRKHAPSSSLSPAPKLPLSGRPVVGSVSVHHRVRGAALLAASTTAGVLGGLALYARQVKAYEPSHFEWSDPGSYDPGVWQGMTAAACVVGGAALPAAVAWAHNLRSRYREGQQQAGQDGAAQVRRIVELARKATPLTLAGLQQASERIGQLRARGEIGGEAAATALADLGAVVPTRSGCGQGWGDAGHGQLQYLVQGLRQLRLASQITPLQFREALVRLAGALGMGAAAALDGKQARALITTLMDAAVDHPEAQSPTLWERADFMVKLAGAPCLAPHREAVFALGASHLHCDPRAYREAMPRLRPPLAADDASTNEWALQQFYAADAHLAPTERAAQLDALVVRLGQTQAYGLTPTQLREFEAQLSAFERQDAELGHACNRARFFLHHWTQPAVPPSEGKGTPGEGEAPTVKPLTPEQAADERMWLGASCGQREALSYLASRPAGQAAALQALSAVFAGPDAVIAALGRAPADQLHGEVSAALGIARNQRLHGVAEAKYLLGLLHALERRNDLPSGLFLEGLRSPEAVQTLADEVVREAGPRLREEQAELLAELPRLCQLQATPELLSHILELLLVRMPASAHRDELMSQAVVLADLSIVRDQRTSAYQAVAGRRPSLSLNQPWVASVQAASAQVRIDEGKAPAQ